MRGARRAKWARSAVLLGCLAALSTPAQAQAQGIRLDPAAQTIHYEAAAGQANLVTVGDAGDAYTLADTGVTAVADADGPGGCEVSGNVATCPAGGVRFIRVSVSDLDDFVTITTAVPGHTFVNAGPGNDTVNGGPGEDQFFGRAGGDALTGNDGDDTLDGGPGDPTLETFDILEGGAGQDTLSYASRTLPVAVDLARQFAVDDDGTVDGLASLERVVGGLGDDEIIGSAASETLLGGPGGYDGADTLCGDLGNDTVDYANKDAGVEVTLDGVLPTDPRHAEPTPNVRARIDCRPVNQVTGAPIEGPRDCTANDGLPGEGDCVGEDIEAVRGTPYSDDLTGNDPDPLTGLSSRVEPLGVNRLAGGGGDDRLDGGLGADEFEGGAGSDTVTYERHESGVAATIDGAANDGNAQDLNPRSQLSDMIEEDVEALVGSPGDDVLKGSSVRNALEGGGGDDHLDAGSGDDTLSAGPGADYASGGSGDDLLTGDDGADTLAGGDGGDTLSGDEGDDALDGGAGPDALAGGGGVDRADYSAATTAVTASADGIPGDGVTAEGDDVGADVESLTGGSGSDFLTGNDAGGELSGGPGDDMLDGRGGPDALIGGPGRDTASYDHRTGPVSADLTSGAAGEPGEGDAVASDVENVHGGAGADVLGGSGDSNVLSGGGGDDTLDGGAGDDTLYGGAGNDALGGAPGNDFVSGEAGGDSLSGGDGADALSGGDGDDSLDGGAGADLLGGETGTDTVVYATRTRSVTVDLEGTPDDGESGENDLVKASIESVRTGTGNDSVDTRDQVAGAISCGAGMDSVTADAQDRVAADCEGAAARALAVCTTVNRAATASSTRVVRIALSCSTAASGRLVLETAGKFAVAKKRRRLRLGTKSFSVPGPRVQRVQVTISARGARLVTVRRKLRVRATITSRARAATRTLKTQRTFTLRRGR